MVEEQVDDASFPEKESAPNGASGISGQTALPFADSNGPEPWYRRNRNRLLIGLLCVGLMVGVAALLINHARGPAAQRSSSSLNQTLPEYLAENDITSTPIRRGEPNSPTISFSLPIGWTDAGSNTPEGAYGAAFYDDSTDSEYPPSVVVLLSKLTGGKAEPAQVLEASLGELKNLPDYETVSEPKRSSLGGFDAIQLSGIYTAEDGAERIIAQKTTVIPTKDGLFVLQINADAPKSEAPILQKATAMLDQQAKVTP